MRILDNGISILRDFFLFFIVVQVQLSPFPPHYSPPMPYPPLPPTFNPPASLSLSMGLVYRFLDDPPFSSLCYPSPCSLLVTVSLLFISMSLYFMFSLFLSTQQCLQCHLFNKFSHRKYSEDMGRW